MQLGRNPTPLRLVGSSHHRVARRMPSAVLLCLDQLTAGNSSSCNFFSHLVCMKLCGGITIFSAYVATIFLHFKRSFNFECSFTAFSRWYHTWEPSICWLPNSVFLNRINYVLDVLWYQVLPLVSAFEELIILFWFWTWCKMLEDSTEISDWS